MTLRSLLESLADNETLNIQIKDSEKDLIEFDAPGFESLNSFLLSRTVLKVTIDSTLSVSTQMIIVVEDN